MSLQSEDLMEMKNCIGLRTTKINEILHKLFSSYGQSHAIVACHQPTCFRPENDSRVSDLLTAHQLQSDGCNRMSYLGVNWMQSGCGRPSGLQKSWLHPQNQQLCAVPPLCFQSGSDLGNSSSPFPGHIQMCPV